MGIAQARLAAEGGGGCIHHRGDTGLGAEGKPHQPQATKGVLSGDLTQLVHVPAGVVARWHMHYQHIRWQ